MTDENKQELPVDDVQVDITAQPDPTAEPDLSTAFGPMDSIDVNSVDFAVLVLCWNLSANKTLGDRQLVNIQTDEEALDILSREGLPTPMRNEDDLWTTGMGFENSTTKKITTRIQLADPSLRVLTARALHVKYTRCDPSIDDVINRFFFFVASQQAKAETNKAQ